MDGPYDTDVGKFSSWRMPCPLYKHSYTSYSVVIPLSLSVAHSAVCWCSLQRLWLRQRRRGGHVQDRLKLSARHLNCVFFSHNCLSSLYETKATSLCGPLLCFYSIAPNPISSKRIKTGCKGTQPTAGYTYIIDKFPEDFHNDKRPLKSPPHESTQTDPKSTEKAKHNQKDVSKRFMQRRRGQKQSCIQNLPYQGIK